MQDGTMTITAEYVRQRLDYDKDTGEFRWRVKLGSDDRTKHWNSRFPGRLAGRVSVQGYRQIELVGKMRAAHRLAWLHVTGSWPRQCLDHINGIKDDNRFANLREATYSENSQNRRKPVNNKSGIIGVCWNKQSIKWQAGIMVKRHLIHIGLFQTKEEAGEAYAEAKKRLHPFSPIPRN